MPIIVQKYGGSSVADVERIGQVADRVAAAREAGNDVVVVVSAMGKTTDGLLALAEKASAPSSTRDLNAAAGAKTTPRRELDMLVSTGERVTMALLSIAMHARGHEAISFTGSQSGILTNDRHFDARIIEVRPHRIEDELARGKVVIVAGYQGMSYKREITTLGRGGSDTTAVALAAALGAERCEIYSDVDGVYSADPRVVPGAAHLPVLDLASLQEMAEAGAKVLNAQAVEWARRAKITLHARKTADDWRGKGGAQPRETVATEHDIGEPPRANHVRAVVGMDRLVLVSGAASALPLLARRAASIELPMADVALEGGRLHATIPLLNVPDWDGRRARLLVDLGAPLELTTGYALVSVVGDGLTTSGDGLATFVEALGDIPVTRLTGGPLRIGAILPAEHLAAAQQRLHRVFVG
jgi:aspartate kinase